MRRSANELLAEIQSVDWPEAAEPTAVRALKDELFAVVYRANLGAEPLTETARRIRGLLDLIVPDEPTDPAADSAVLTPEEAALYLGLDRLGVTNPAKRVRYLVKKKRIRPSYILGRLAFQRSDLDEYLGVEPWCPYDLRHTAASRIRREHGEEAARVILGHSSIDTTRLYGEVDRQKAIEVAAATG